MWKKEGVYLEIKMNSVGFCDYEWSKNKLENGLRIVLLEDYYIGVF